MPSFVQRLAGQPWLFAGVLSVLLIIANAIADPSFVHPDNLPRQFAALAPLALVAMASTPAILTGHGGLDLSVGPLMVMCNVILVQELLPAGIDSVWETVPLLLAVGLAVGVINGVLSTVLRYLPIIATLCMAFVIIGINEKLDSESISAPANWTSDLTGSIGPVPGGLLLMAAPVVIWLLLGLSSYHRNLYAVGGNDVAAFSAGVNVTITRLFAYAMGGVFAAIGGIALTAVVQSSQGQTASFYIIVGLTAVALGGTSLGGGRGGITGAIFGAATLFLMQNLLSTLSVRAEWINVVYGVLLVIGVVIGTRGGVVRWPSRAVSPA